MRLTRHQSFVLMEMLKGPLYSNNSGGRISPPMGSTLDTVASSTVAALQKANMIEIVIPEMRRFTFWRLTKEGREVATNWRDEFGRRIGGT